MPNTAHSRRVLLASAAGSTLVGALFCAFEVPAWAEKGAGQSKIGNLKPVTFRRSAKGAGSIGPWGEVRLLESEKGAVPNFVQSADMGGVLDLTGQRGFLSLGGGALVMTSAGIAFSKGGALEPWNDATIDRLIRTLADNAEMRRSVFQLRSALFSSYFVAISGGKTGNGGKTTGEAKSAAAVLRHTKAVGADALKQTCTTTSVTDTVRRTVENTVRVVQTAEEQYLKCVADGKRNGDFFPEVGCIAQGFVDVFVGWTTILTTVVEEVTRQVVTCVTTAATNVVHGLPNLWNGVPTVFSGLKGAEKGKSISGGDLAKALQQLKKMLAFLPPFAQCLMDGEWSIATLNTGFRSDDNEITVPYGVKVCLTAACAHQLSITEVGGNFLAAAGTILAMLEALSPEIAALLLPILGGPATWGIPLAATAFTAVATIVGSIPEVVVAAMIVILVDLLLILYHATAVAAQIAACEQFFPGALADGQLCIEHPTIALALIVLMLGIPPVSGGVAALFPPIVTG